METDEEAKETETKEKETKKEEVTPQVKKELVSCSFILWFYMVPQKYLHSRWGGLCAHTRKKTFMAVRE